MSGGSTPPVRRGAGLARRVERFAGNAVVDQGGETRVGARRHAIVGRRGGRGEQALDLPLLSRAARDPGSGAAVEAAANRAVTVAIRKP